MHSQPRKAAALGRLMGKHDSVCIYMVPARLDRSQGCTVLNIARHWRIFDLPHASQQHGYSAGMCMSTPPSMYRLGQTLELHSQQRTSAASGCLFASMSPHVPDPGWTIRMHPHHFVCCMHLCCYLIIQHMSSHRL